MERRRPVVAGMFYEGSEAGCREAVQGCVGGYAAPQDMGVLVGGIVPHAGWAYSGPTAAKVFVALQGVKPQTFVFFGAVHRSFKRTPTAFPGGAWRTPLGDVEIDGEVLAAVAGAGVDVSSREHAEEHSIEVQLPFLQVLHPEAKMVAVAMPPHAGAAEAGRRIGAALAKLGRPVVVVGSTDLTHYGMGYQGAHHGPLPQALPWMRQNDARMIALIERLDSESVLEEAEEHENACGPGAVAAAIASARELGARRGRTLEYTTSADVTGETDSDRAVGYAAAVFEK